MGMHQCESVIESRPGCYQANQLNNQPASYNHFYNYFNIDNRKALKFIYI